MLATLVIQPHIKGNITPQKLLPFAWDKKTRESEPGPQLTPEQRQQRFKELTARLGDQTI